MRRDEIWFTEMTRLSATSLYSPAEFKLPDGTKVRNDAALEANYIRARYGAIPYLGNFEFQRVCASPVPKSRAQFRA